LYFVTPNSSFVYPSRIDQFSGGKFEYSSKCTTDILGNLSRIDQSLGGKFEYSSKCTTDILGNFVK